MRVGINPRKDKKLEPASYWHQVVVPVYIPNSEGYFEESFQILQNSLESLFKTCHPQTFLTVVNNGSCNEVKTYLDNLLAQNKIKEVIHTRNIGKINAIAKAVSGHMFPLVTVTDADVLFMPGWQKAVYEIYENFPLAGMVGTTPLSWHCKYLNENVFIDNLFNKKFKFRSVKNPQAVEMFYKSIGWGFVNPEIHKEKILSLEENDVVACLGCGHYAFTIKSGLLHHLKKNYADELLSPKNDKDFIDLPSVAYGHWRLSTYENYTFHMGNKLESWMTEAMAQIKNHEGLAFVQAPQLAKKRLNRYFVRFKKYLVRGLLYKDFIFTRVLTHKGLTKEQVRKFTNNYYTKKGLMKDFKLII